MGGAFWLKADRADGGVQLSCAGLGNLIPVPSAHVTDMRGGFNTLGAQAEEVRARPLSP